MMTSRSCVVLGSPCAVLANEPAIMNGTCAWPVAETRRLSRSSTSLISRTRTRELVGEVFTVKRAQDDVKRLRVRELGMAPLDTIDRDLPSVLTHSDGDT
jgi:hypothetical protein